MTEINKNANCVFFCLISLKDLILALEFHKNFCEITMCQKVGLDQLLSKSWVLLELDDKSNNSDVLLSRSLNKGGIDTIKYFG